VRHSRALVLGSLLVLPSRGAAHSPQPGLEGFYVGLLHPLSAPDQVLALVATALLFGSFAMSSLLPAFAALALGHLAGLVWGHRGDEGAQTLLGLAVCAAVWAALFPGRGLILLGAVALTGGFALGWASVPDAGPVMDRTTTMSGSFFGAGLAVFYLTGAVEWLRDRIATPWLDIGFRVLAAWVAAIAIILLALTAAGTDGTL